MNSSTVTALLVYAVPTALVVVWFLWRRDRNDRRTQTGIEAARAEGLDVPPSLHPWVDPGRCLGSGACIAACPETDVLGMLQGKAVLVTAANCVGHGACKDACPFDAITLVIGTRERGVEVPVLDPNFETNLPGLFVVGELGGMGLIRNAITQGRQVIDHVRGMQGVGSGDRTDVVIIGAGPSGFAATLAAHGHGLRYRTLEQDSLGGAVAHYPRRKLVLTSPVELPLVGVVKMRETTKESLLELWHQTERDTGIRIDYGETVSSIVRDAQGFRVTSTSGEIACRAVVLAIGRRGTPRRLGAPGEELPKVAYMLEDPEELRGRRTLVVGAGDSALEAAIALADQPGTEVTLSCRGDSFGRAKPPNRARIDECERAGRVRIVRSSTVKGIDETSVVLATADGEERIANDAVFVCAGGELPFGFLREVGVEMEMMHGEP
jgi:thioredoxin reductase/NAD-dependent dihydropyrimidine dehydrogenase PreA subunit